MAVAAAALELVISLVSSTMVAAKICQTCVSIVACSIGTYEDLFGFDAEVEFVGKVVGIRRRKFIIRWRE
jgi:hypothetical protein